MRRRKNGRRVCDWVWPKCHGGYSSRRSSIGSVVARRTAVAIAVAIATDAAATAVAIPVTAEAAATAAAIAEAAAAIVALAIAIDLAHHRGGAFLVLLDADREVAQHVLVEPFLPLDLVDRGRRRVDVEQREMRLAVLAHAGRRAT